MLSNLRRTDALILWIEADAFFGISQLCVAQYDVSCLSVDEVKVFLLSQTADPTGMQLHPIPACSVPAPVIKALIKCLLMYLDCESGCNQVKQN